MGEESEEGEKKKKKEKTGGSYEGLRAFQKLIKI